MPEQAQATPTTKSRSARGLWVGLLSVPLVSYATVNMPQSSMFSLLAVPVGVLMLAAGISAVWRAIFGARLLSFADLCALYGTASVASVMSAEWMVFSAATVHQLPFLSEGNPTVKEVILPHLPNWLVIKELGPVQDLVTSGYGLAHVLHKLPLFLPRWLAWSALFLSVACACLCVNSLMSRLWVEREKLAFPIIQLPLEIARCERNFWGRKAVWIAFSIVFAIDILNGFNYWYPNVPKIPIKQLADLSPYLQIPALSHLGELPLGIYPFLAALGLLMPMDLLVSVLVFFALRKATHWTLGSIGIEQSTFSGTYFAPGAPYWEQQAWGAVLALFVGSLYVSRRYLREVWQEVWAGQNRGAGPSHRAAFVGLLVCMAVFLWFGTVGALPLGFSIAYFVAFLAFSYVLTRLRAQLGAPTHEFAYFGPNGLLSQFGAMGGVGEKGQVWISQALLFMNRISRTHPMPTQLESLKLVDLSGARRAPMVWGMLGAMGLALMCAYVFSLAHSYRLGAPIGSQDGIGMLQGMMGQPSKFQPAGVGMIGFGFAFALGLDALRMRFPAFALHPAGYLLGITYGIDYYWFGLVLALVAKFAVQRYSRAKGYPTLRQVAIGLMLGEYAAEAIWISVALITKQSTYTIGFNDRSLGVQ